MKFITYLRKSKKNMENYNQQEEELRYNDDQRYDAEYADWLYYNR